MESVGTALKSSFTEIGSSITGLIGDILPIAMPIVGAGIVIGVVVAIFKKVTHK